ncbi:hypothetical protein AB6A40_000470 [Gnathostoma spinigerum]|uniref:Uncharacterized protein n=1 Tax=Gnathostoma spinigerum TaxID=75299 RepID=A0ABD6E3E1_9BILA
MQSNFFVYVLLAISTTLIECCRLQLRVNSLTDKPFEFQAYVPAIKVKTDRVRFNANGQHRVALIEGNNCNEKHWVFKTWSLKEDKWIPAHEIKLKLEGNGYYGVNIDDNHQMKRKEMFAVLCSEGPC